MQGKGKAWEEMDVREEPAITGDAGKLRDGLAGVGDDQDLRDGFDRVGDNQDLQDGSAGAEDNAGMWEKQGKGIEMREEAKEKGAKDQAALERELKARLEWYAAHVSDEAYDAKAVEYILYLLDSIAPLEEGAVPPKEEAWERFLAIADSQEEILPLEHGVDGLRPVAGAEELAGTGGGKSGKMLKFRRFVARHKVIAAAVFMAVILAVGGSIQAGARRGEGFFFWLKEDDEGATMITSPKNLDNGMDVKGYTYFNRDDVPEWAQDWIQMEENVEIPDNYEWKCFETSEFENYRVVFSKYQDKDSDQNIILGTVIYFQKVSYNRKRYIDYDYMQNYEIGKRKLNVYSRKEESGKIYYAICLDENDIEYFIEGQDNLEEIKKLMENYLECLESEKNEKIL